MAQLKVYHYPACGTCRKAVNWLKQHGHELTLVNIAEQPPSADELGEMVPLSGLALRKWFNTSGEVYKREKLKDVLPGLGEREQLELLAANGMLIKRPVVRGGQAVTVGFNEEHYEQVWGQEG